MSWLFEHQGVAGCLSSRTRCLAFHYIDWNAVKYIPLSKPRCCPSWWGPSCLQPQKFQGWFSNWWSLTCSFCGCLNICGTSRGIYLLLSRRDLTQQLLTNAGTSDGDGGLGPNSWGERFEFTSPILSICKSESTWVCVVLGASGTWSGCCCLHLQLRRAFTMCDCAGGSDAEVASV